MHTMQSNRVNYLEYLKSARWINFVPLKHNFVSKCTNNKHICSFFNGFEKSLQVIFTVMLWNIITI